MTNDVNDGNFLCVASVKNQMLDLEVSVSYYSPLVVCDTFSGIRNEIL